MRLRRFFSGVVASAVFVVGGAAGAFAAVPDPTSGPAAGGTTVTVDVPGVTLTEVSAGQYHSLALGSDGNAYSWGQNAYGQLGNNSTTDSSVPVLVQAPPGVRFTEVSAGYAHSVAVGSDGNTYAWGQNGSGQLGNDSTADSSVPVVVQAPTGVTFTDVSAGDSYALAVGSDGNTYAWGWNTYGELGDNTTTNRSVPVVVHAPTGVTFAQVSAGGSHSLAVGSDGKTYAWGWNLFGQLGTNSNASVLVPVLVQTPPGVTFTQVSSGLYHSLAVGSDDNTYAWGYNVFGQLGNNSTTDSWVPMLVQTPPGVTFTQISAGLSQSSALGSDENAYAWGWNGLGGLGNGSTANSSVPVLVQAPTGVTFTQVSAGYAHSLAVGSDNSAYSWGSNAHGQLGDNSTTNSSVPVRVLGPVVVVTGVVFGGVAGASVVDNGDGTASVVTPAHAGGVVDVAVEWTLAGVAQTPVTYTDGFTFTQAPTVTDPTDQTVTLGATAVFSVTATGFPVPTVAWEVSRDAGTTWESITSDTGATVSVNGLELKVVTGSTHDGSLYRAIATNSVGNAVSDPASVTVATNNPGPGDNGNGNNGNGSNTGTGNDSGNSSGASRLPATGNELPTGWIAAASALLLTGLLLTAATKRKRI